MVKPRRYFDAMLTKKKIKASDVIPVIARKKNKSKLKARYRITKFIIWPGSPKVRLYFSAIKLNSMTTMRTEIANFTLHIIAWKKMKRAK